MKTPLAIVFKCSFFLLFFSGFSQAQISLLSEDFNSCSFPVGWSLNVIGDGTPVYTVGMPDNGDSDGSTIDGSCMLIIDDDETGDNTPAYTIQVISSAFDGTQFPLIELNLDVHWRPYQGSTLKIKVFDGVNYHEVRSWGDGDATGEQFSEFENVTLDLSFFASSNMQLVIEYDDNGIWGWWAGVDNIEIVGKGSGTNVVLETFNDCTIPTGWTTQIQQGDDDWQFGFIDNGNASSNSMNGTCFAYFDDDGLGQDAAFSNALLISPVFSGSQFANYTLQMDMVFRKYADLEQVSVWVWDGSEAQLVQTFSEDVGGPQFMEHQQVEVDLSAFRSESMQVVIAYFDGNAWGWWAGIDNFKVIGDGQINDLCENAFELGTGTDCLEGNNLNAIFDGSQPGCSDENIASIWYRYTADFTGILKIETKADFNDVITVYSGNCTTTSETACINRDEFGFTGEALYMDVSSGTEYLIRISGKEEAFGLARGQFCISAEQVSSYPVPPINDDCANAIPLTVNNTCYTGNNLNADFNGPEPSLNLKSRADIWYVFEATTSEEIEIQTNADFADVITLYSGICGTLSEVASNEYGQVLRTSGLQVGENYYIQIAGYFATVEGNLCIAVTETNPVPADNDLCANATEIIVGGGCVQGQNILANFDGPNPSCEIFSEANIWYQFIAPSSGGVKVNTGAEFVHSVAIFSGDCNELTELMCLNNPTRCDGYFEVGGLIPGETYFIQIASSLNTFGFIEGDLCISLLDYNSTSDFQPLELAININCITDGFGMIEYTATGGVGAYTFQGNTMQDTFATGEQYIVVVSDENNCEVSRIGTVECGGLPCVLTTELSALSVSCFGESNGQAFVEPLSGTGPYTYQWSNGATSALVNGLDVGVYSVTVQDAEGCPAELSVEITEPDLLLANIEATAESAEDTNDGTASVNPNGGTAPYTYVWSNGGNSQTIENLEPGIYSVTLTDANDCSIIESAVVSAFGCSLGVDFEVQEISCNGANDAFIEVYPQGGAEPFIYAWSNGANTDMVNNLGIGTYTVTVTDANGCPWIENFTFTEPAVLEVAATAINPADCNGNNTGTVTVMATGGTAPYTYAWSNGGVGETQNDLFAGDYTVTVTDGNGCTETHAIEILEPAMVTPMSVNPQDVSCFGNNDGVGTILVEGGTSPYTYLWDDPANQTNSQATNLASGTYNVLVTDANGCTGNASVTINEPGEIALTVDAVFDETNGQSNGAISITLSGGIAPYTYQWLYNGTNYSNSADLTNLPAGEYVLQITDANDCIQTFESIIVDNLVGISDPELEARIDLLPNPSSGIFQLNIALENSSNVNIMITDVSGKILIRTDREQINIKTYDFNFSEWPAAVYPIKIFIDDKIVLKQLVIQK